MYVVKSEFTMKKDKICIIYPEWACKTEMKDFWRYISKNQTSKRDIRGMCQKQQTVLKNAASDSMRILSNLKSRPNLTIGLIWALPGIVVLILLQLRVNRPLRVWWNPTFSCTVSQCNGGYCSRRTRGWWNNVFSSTTGYETVLESGDAIPPPHFWLILSLAIFVSN